VQTTVDMKKQTEGKKLKLHSFRQKLGPGLITGASDDDPSGIATYTQAGASMGYRLLWTSLLTFPLMSGIQEMCARIGLVTRMGLAGVVKKHYPKWVLYAVILFSFPAITLNIGADLAGMGAVSNLLIPSISAHEFSLIFTLLLIVSIIFLPYIQLTAILRWLCITLFCYCAIPFLVHQDWLAILRYSFIPDINFSSDYLAALVGILGTTISPYLFFWQASVEVEELRAHHLVVDKQLIHEMRTDVRTGIGFSNLVFYFIIIASGSVIFHSGNHNIVTVEDAAKALEPLAGHKAYLLFAIGVIGTGLLAIPVLAGSLSYIISETFNWTEGLDKQFHQAKKFYSVIVFSLILAESIEYLQISPVKALIYTAILYGITAPVMIGVILHICNNKQIMGENVNSRMANIIGWITLIIMLVAACLYLYS
jgi:NRAMP (natural resistance-associated macrophage protein)-like metal ion transporter